MQLCLNTVVGGVGYCGEHKLTYYNLDMSAFGCNYVDKNGFKRRCTDKKIMLACAEKYKGQELVSGAVCVDTGGFAQTNPEQIDIAMGI
ncbi:MAG: hypothetical protein LBB10_02270 [Bifidobacteriaceae bacterium]|jgi:hypothetical protein|nr:hypothetical protein [Bifidobacteriaceae bacterium]